MEQKKTNNAVKKVENVQKSASPKTTSVKKKKTAVKQNNAKSDRKTAKAKLAEEKRLKRREMLAEREKIRAQKRIELAKIREDKKVEREKAKQAAIRERNRKAAELKARKAEIKAEKEKRKAMLKSESKAQRQKRIAAENAEKRRIAQERAQQKAQIRAQKLQDKKLRREQKSRERQKNRGFGGWLAAVISLGVATLILAGVLTSVLLIPDETDNLMEATYQRYFYDAVSAVDNIDLNLSKTLASEDSGAQQRYLVDLAIESELAENDIQQLPLQDESKFYTTKLINQIGDYAKSLNDKLTRGENLTASEKETLYKLYQANLTLKDSFTKMRAEMGDDFNFSTIKNNDKGNVVIANFNELQNLSVQYPELIYDGPFSDGMKEREAKGLNGNEISAQEAQEKFMKIFADNGISDIKDEGVTGGTFECYNFEATMEGNRLYGQISKKGGELIMFNYNHNCSEEKLTQSESLEKAAEFLNKIGLEDMQPVWENSSENVATINFALKLKGIIIYPDMVKVKVCRETGMVIGLEASAYYLNHTERNIGEPTLSVAAAQAKVSANIDVETSRLAVIPIGTSSETLAYEFSGTYDGSTYYAYIDAETGAQVEMFKVVKTTEGTLLI